MAITLAKAFGAAPAALVLGAVGLAAEALERLNCYRRARRERDQLLAFGERDLRDLGLSRVDALRVANQPLWSGCGSRGFDLGRPQL